MTSCGSDRIDRTKEIETLDHRPRTEADRFDQPCLDRLIGVGPRPEGVDLDRNGVGHADDVGQLDLAASCEAGSDDVLGRPTSTVCRGSIDLRGVLATEGSPTGAP